MSVWVHAFSCLLSAGLGSERFWQGPRSGEAFLGLERVRGGVWCRSSFWLGGLEGGEVEGREGHIFFGVAVYCVFFLMG